MHQSCKMTQTKPSRSGTWELCEFGTERWCTQWRKYVSAGCIPLYCFKSSFNSCSPLC